jgi:hypothetical protein
MTAAPVIEAVRRAGGRILVRGAHLRLSAPEPLPDTLIAEVRQHKAEILDLLGTAAPALSERQRPSASPAQTVETSVERWRRGVERLCSMWPPQDYPEPAWTQLAADAERFLERWGLPAARLGWPAWELFGCHHHAPFGRIEGMGLVLLLRGKELIALTDAEAVIRTATGAHQTYRRKPHDPLHPVERCLVWELRDA